MTILALTIEQERLLERFIRVARQGPDAGRHLFYIRSNYDKSEHYVAAAAWGDDTSIMLSDVEELVRQGMLQRELSAHPLYGVTITQVGFAYLDSLKGRDRAYSSNIEEASVAMSNHVEEYDYDVAVSFAGSERGLAAQLATIVRDNGYEIFYDEFAPHKLWGEDLSVYFDEVFRKRSRYCVIFVSESYLDRPWTTHERRSAVSRTVQERGRAYILPIQIDDVELPGLANTMGYLSLKSYSIEQIAEILIAKLDEGANPGEVSMLLAESESNPSSLRALVSIYRAHPIDYELFHSTIPQWSDGLVRAMVSTTPNALARIISQIDRHLPQYFPFEYLDTLATWLGKIYRLSDNKRVSQASLDELLRLGEKYDEVDMGRTFAKLAAQANTAKDMKTIVDALLRHPDRAAWVGPFLERTGVANKVADTLKRQKLAHYQDKDID